MIKIAIVEDEAVAANLLQKYINQYFSEKDEKFVVTLFDRAVKLLENYKNNFDLIFMDIDLPEMDGMTAARKLRELDPVTHLVFVTNLSQYAVNGYEVDALDYIIKPITYYNFSMKMDKAIRIIKRNSDINLNVPIKGGMKIIPSMSISYIEVLDHDLFYHTEEEVIKTRGSLNRLDSLLNATTFVKTSVNCLVNMKYIAGIEGNVIKLLTGEEVYMSRSRKKEVLDILAKYLGGSI